MAEITSVCGIISEKKLLRDLVMQAGYSSRTLLMALFSSVCDKVASS